jgi:hypothetical protein
MSHDINQAILEALFITEYEKIDRVFPATSEKKKQELAQKFAEKEFERRSR